MGESQERLAAGLLQWNYYNLSSPEVSFYRITYLALNSARWICYNKRMEPINTQSRFSAGPQVSPELQGRRAMRRKLVVIIIGVVVIIAAAVGWWMYKNREISTEIAPGQTLVTAQQGNIVSEFPRELIIEEGIAVSESYRIEYAEGGVGQPVAVYDSKLTMAENFTAFRAYLEDNGWRIRNESAPDGSSVAFIYAVTDDADVNVTLEPMPDGKARVSISYVAKR